MWFKWLFLFGVMNPALADTIVHFNLYSGYRVGVRCPSDADRLHFKKNAERLLCRHDDVSFRWTELDKHGRPRYATTDYDKAESVCADYSDQVLTVNQTGRFKFEVEVECRGVYADVCNRPPLVKKALERASKKRCGQISTDDLAKIKKLKIAGRPKSKSTLRKLRSDDLRGLSGLNDLVIFRAGLRSIAPGAFGGLENLTSLAIINNSLGLLHKDAFKGLGKLKKLTIANRLFFDFKKTAHNKSGEHGTSGYAALVEKHFDHGKAKKPRVLDIRVKGVFRDLTSLKHLNLAGSGVKLAPGMFARAFGGPSKTLKSLDLGGLSFPGGFRKKMKKARAGKKARLHKKHPGYCHKKHHYRRMMKMVRKSPYTHQKFPPAHAFSGLRGLKRINLSHNNFRTVDTNSLKSVLRTSPKAQIILRGTRIDRIGLPSKHGGGGSLGRHSLGNADPTLVETDLTSGAVEVEPTEIEERAGGSGE